MKRWRDDLQWFAVEKGAILIEHAFRHWCDGSLESFKKLAREILSLFPEPVLTRISDEELDLRWQRIINSTEKGWLEAGVREIAEAQLAHDQETLRQSGTKEMR